MVQNFLCQVKSDYFKPSSRINFNNIYIQSVAISPQEFTGEQQCQSAVSIKLQSNFIEITLRYECSPVNLLNIFKTVFPKNTYGGLILFCLVLRFHFAQIKIFSILQIIIAGRKDSSSARF